MNEYVGCLVILLIFGASWLLMCGIVKLFTLLIGVPFDWAIATAVWLLAFLWKMVVG